LYLSNYEGFGIPIVEAMKSGCPFVTYNNASIPEIAKEGGVILSPFLEIDEIVKNVLSLEDLTYRNKVILDGLAVAKNYSWDKCFQETKEFHKLILFNK
jgi:mannosyltransferase